MSSSHNSSHTTATEPSAEMAAQILRERIGQENVTQSSVLASRRLDEALLRLERASERSRLEPSRPAPTPEPPAEFERKERVAPLERIPHQGRVEPAIADSHAHASEMSADAIEALFGQPIDVMILSTKAKIDEDRVLQPSDTPGPSPHRDELQSPPTVPRPPESAVPAPVVTAASPPPANPTVSSESVPEPACITPPATESPCQGESSHEFVAAWQVDELIVPSTIDELFLADSLAEQLAVRLAEARSEGLQTIAITSANRGEGRSTVALGLALSIAFSGLRVALVDADRHGGHLASDLQLDLDHSWVEAIRSGVPLEEIAVTSQADALTLLPLLETEEGANFAHEELEMMLARLKESFDMIVVDCGASAIDDIVLCGTALIVRDNQRTAASEVEGLSRSLRSRGVQGVGVIENFCDE